MFRPPWDPALFGLAIGYKHLRAFERLTCLFPLSCSLTPRRPSHLPSSPSNQDAARVCNSLLRTNARALGDSRLSLSRSVTQLELLNARMDGTARGFAKSFGAGWHRTEGGGP